MHQHTKRILGIGGSLRLHSWNRRLVLAARGLAPDGVVLDVYERLGEVPLFNEDLEADPPAGVAHLRAVVSAADGLLLATPEYNHALPAVLKNVVDWLSRGDPSWLQGKPVAIIGASTGSWGTRLAQAALRQTLFATGARVMVEPMLFVAQAASRFDGEGELADAALAKFLSEVLAAFGSWVGLAGPALYRQSHQR